MRDAITQPLIDPLLPDGLLCILDLVVLGAIGAQNVHLVAFQLQAGELVVERTNLA